MAKTEVILQVISSIALTYVYFRLCSNRESTLLNKIMEISSMYGVSALAFLGNIKFWTFLLGFVVIGVIKLLTTKKAKVEREYTGVDL